VANSLYRCLLLFWLRFLWLKIICKHLVWFVL
jgi:hypothetical protein